MIAIDPRRWLRHVRRGIARLPTPRLGRVPDAPALSVRDPWPGDAERGARLLRDELALGGGVIKLTAGHWPSRGPDPLLAFAHSFLWLRDLRALGTDDARLRARALVSDWIVTTPTDTIAHRPDVVGARLTAWLGHYDFFVATANDDFRQNLMTRLVTDARSLSAALPAEEMDARALTALKGLVAAAVALPDQTGLLTRALRFLPQEIGRQILPDGCHVERSPAAQLSALRDLVEIRTLLQARQTAPPLDLPAAIERMIPALRLLRHGDGGLALFNGGKEEGQAAVEQALSQAGRGGREATTLPSGRFQRMRAGPSLVLVDVGPPPPPGLDRLSHAGTLSMEVSIGKERLIVNCGGFPAGAEEWREAMRKTAAHSTLVVADLDSAEVRPDGLGRRPAEVKTQYQEINGAHWLEAEHDGWRRSLGAIHRRRVYLAESGEEIIGDDVVEASQPVSFVVRFHLHPSVAAAALQDGEAVLMRLPSGGGWRLRSDAPTMRIEDSIYLGGDTPRKTKQIVLSTSADGPQTIKWFLMKIG